jgi:hypothetical protein
MSDYLLYNVPETRNWTHLYFAKLNYLRLRKAYFKLMKAGENFLEEEKQE